MKSEKNKQQQEKVVSGNLPTEEELQAVEDFIAETQYRIWQLMQDRSMSQSKLASNLGISKSRVSQYFSDRPNFTLETIARIFFALNEKPCISSPTIESILGNIGSEVYEPEFEYGEEDKDDIFNAEGFLSQIGLTAKQAYEIEAMLGHARLYEVDSRNRKISNDSERSCGYNFDVHVAA